jgi:hypothetical protein
MNTIDRRRLGSFALLGAAAAGLTACGAAGAAVTSASQALATDAGKVAATVTTDATTATTLWGIVKGLGQVALTVLDVSDPAAAALINTGIAAADAAVAALQTPAVQADAAQVASNVSTILANVQTVANATVGTFTAVANKA